jgi:hypothetical protein
MALSSELLNRGSFQIATPVNPAAGANLIWPVPGQQRIEVLYIHFALVTSAAVANRFATIQFVGPLGDIIWRSPPALVQTASQTRHYYAAAGPNLMPVAYTDANQLWLPNRNILGAVCTIETNIGAIDALDQVFAAAITYLRQATPA